MFTSHQIRSGFIDFFKNRGHTFVPSAPVVPIGDPTLLFTNAGMNQFKDIFTGGRIPQYNRAANSQKCIRVSGKHNDLEEVGPSNRHHTFFEMLGNWSFGDYYKKEAIAWAWELLTEIWMLPKDKLYATVYLDDDEAEACWKSQTDIASDSISRHGAKDNFWEMGETGPCGPCSEIHIDMGPQACDKKGTEHTCEVNGICGRYTELWNLVFIQYNRDREGNLTELPAKHVDTGAGLERLAVVLQGGLSNYDSDLFQPIISRTEELSSVEYERSAIPHRVIADHLRALAFAIADGALPSNEGRGYVLRRILRRASRYGHDLGMREPFIYKLVPTLVDLMGGYFPELKDKHQHIALTIKSEEQGFTAALERGMDIFQSMVEKLKSRAESVIAGEDAFKLYDTYGFPLDLTQLLARERGFAVDVEGYNAAMEGQRARARDSGAFKTAVGVETEWKVTSDLGNRSPEEWQTFTGYDFEDYQSEVVKLRNADGFFEVVVRETPFYAEAGGQVGDKGVIETADGTQFKITGSYYDNVGQRALKVDGDYQKFSSVIEDNPQVILQVDSARRMRIRRNHTATHLLHFALRKFLGAHVQQAGSLVHPDYLRFDYTHYQKPEFDTLLKVEAEVNRLIMENSEVAAENTSHDRARELGAIALFGEKYGEEVRMISVGDFSRELCGGTHVRRSGDIGHFRITSETGVSAGVRRIEAVTGEAALQAVMEERRAVEGFKEILHSHGSDVTEKLVKFAAEKKELEREVEKLRKSGGGWDLNQLLEGAVVKNGAKIVAKRVEVPDMEALKNLGDLVREKIKSGIGILGAEIGGKAALVCVVTDDLIEKGIKAGELVKKTAKAIGGGGGGRPHLATAGAKDASSLEKAFEEGLKLAQEAVK